MNPRSRNSTTESVCSLTKIEAVNDSFHQQLTATLKQDIDWNFIDFIIDYLLSSDKDGPQEADVDKLIQNYVKLNPQLREQLVTMLKNLAEGKEIRIEPSHDAAVLPKKSLKVKTDESVSMIAPSKTNSVLKSPSSSRSPKRNSSHTSHAASRTSSSSDVVEKSTSELAKTSTSDRTECSTLIANRIAEMANPDPSAASSSKLKASSKLTVDGPGTVSKTSPTSSEPQAPPPSPRDAQPPLNVGYVRVAGATAKALQLLRWEDHCIDDIALVSTTPKRIDDSDCDELFQFAGCTYDEFLRFESAGGSTKKKRKRNKKKNKKKNHCVADDDNTVDPSTATLGAGHEAAEASISSSVEDVRAAAEVALPKDDEDDQDNEGAVAKEKERLAALASRVRTPSTEDSGVGSADAPSTSSGHTSAVLAITKPLRLVKDIESRAPMTLARSDILLEKEFKFQSVSQAECGVVTSWDDLKELVAEVFPNDSELQEAFATKAHNSLDLWKFIVKYGRMYKDFVSEVLEMVNELKKVRSVFDVASVEVAENSLYSFNWNLWSPLTSTMNCPNARHLFPQGLIDAMDMHREKTNEILETHKKEMCSVVEKARAADYRIEVLEKELEDHRLSADDQKVKAFTQEEEIQKLQKDLSAKEKRLRDFDNVKRELLSERNKAKEERDRLAAEHEKTKSELLKAKSESDSLRTRLKRSREGAEETDYRLRELESKLCDEQAETEKLKESNARLAKKTEALQNEIERLREKQARQRVIETANKASTLPSCNIAPSATDSHRAPSVKPGSSCLSSSARGSFFSSVIAPLPNRSNANPQYHSSSGYLSSPARVVGSPSSKMFPQNNNQSSSIRLSPFSSCAEPVGSQVSARTSYAAASAGSTKDAFGQSYSYRDSALGKQLKDGDSEVHSLLTPNEPSSKYRSDFPPTHAAGSGNRPMYDDNASRVLNRANSKAESSQSQVSTSLPSFASLFSKDDAPTQSSGVPYSPWGNPNYGELHDIQLRLTRCISFLVESISGAARILS